MIALGQRGVRRTVRSGAQGAVRTARQHELEVVEVAREERPLAVGEVELPQAEEGVVESERPHPLGLRQEPLTPHPQRLCVVRSEVLERLHRQPR